jgi:hypothetical protein
MQLAVTLLHLASVCCRSGFLCADGSADAQRGALAYRLRNWSLERDRLSWHIFSRFTAGWLVRDPASGANSLLALLASHHPPSSSALHSNKATGRWLTSRNWVPQRSQRRGLNPPIDFYFYFVFFFFIMQADQTSVAFDLV